MVEKGYEVVWTKRSQKQMRQVFKHISKDSPKNASKVICNYTPSTPASSN